MGFKHSIIYGLMAIRHGPESTYLTVISEIEQKFPNSYLNSRISVHTLCSRTPGY